jgi:hypothetical protein
MDGWSGNMSYSYFPTSSDCSGTEPLYFGYETYVKDLLPIVLKNFESLLAPPTSESFGKIGESSQEELNEYWQYYFDNSCLGMMDVASSSTTTSLSSSGHVARGNYMFQLGILPLIISSFSMLVELNWLSMDGFKISTSHSTYTRLWK